MKCFFLCNSAFSFIFLPVAHRLLYACYCYRYFAHNDLSGRFRVLSLFAIYASRVFDMGNSLICKCYTYLNAVNISQYEASLRVLL